ncbi:MAG TPA: tetratricopeptide repeat protein, partial [Thermoanaerobaculia bacterium]|nr:tetratricopeptide repeat protein [Thermoanaerobaculia bacterium]
EPLFRQAVAAFKSAFGEGDFRVADTLGNLGAVLEGEEKYEEAAAVHARSLEIRRRIYGDHGPVVAQSYLHLAETRRKLGQTAAALPLGQKALAVMEEALGREHPLVAYPHQVLGLILRDRGDPAAAEPHLRQSLALMARAMPPGHPQLALNKIELATCLTDLGRLDEAEALLRQIEPGMRAQLGPAKVKRLDASLDEIARRRGTMARAANRGEPQ